MRDESGSTCPMVFLQFCLCFPNDFLTELPSRRIDDIASSGFDPTSHWSRVFVCRVTEQTVDSVCVNYDAHQNSIIRKTKESIRLTHEEVPVTFGHIEEIPVLVHP